MKNLIAVAVVSPMGFHISMVGRFFRPKFQGISQENMAKNMVLTYLHFRILTFPWIGAAVRFLGFDTERGRMDA